MRRSTTYNEAKPKLSFYYMSAAQDSRGDQTLFSESILSILPNVQQHWKLMFAVSVNCSVL